MNIESWEPIPAAKLAIERNEYSCTNKRPNWIDIDAANKAMSADLILAHLPSMPADRRPFAMANLRVLRDQLRVVLDTLREQLEALSIVPGGAAGMASKRIEERVERVETVLLAVALECGA